MSQPPSSYQASSPAGLPADLDTLADRLAVAVAARMSPIPRRWLSISETIQAYPIGRKTLMALINAGHVRASRISDDGHKLAIDARSLDAYLESRRI